MIYSANGSCIFCKVTNCARMEILGTWGGPTENGRGLRTDHRTRFACRHPIACIFFSAERQALSEVVQEKSHRSDAGKAANTPEARCIVSAERNSSSIIDGCRRAGAANALRSMRKMRIVERVTHHAALDLRCNRYAAFKSSSVISPPERSTIWAARSGDGNCSPFSIRLTADCGIPSRSPAFTWSRSFEVRHSKRFMREIYTHNA